MKKQLGLAKFLAISAILLPCLSGTAAIVYDNTAGDLGRFYATNAEFGDQITLGGTERQVTDFSFYAFVQTAGITYTLRFYNNDGTSPAGSPGTSPLFQSDPQPITQTGNQTFTVSGLSVAVPDTLTWTVQFSGSGSEAGLLLYNPPSPGSSLNDFWQNNGGAWSLAQIDGGAVVANFAARMTAVPEPGSIALG